MREPFVNAARARWRGRRWFGRKGSASRSEGSARRIATSISSSGFAVETDQSEPNARVAPEACRDANGYCSGARSGPRNGIVSSSICGSCWAQYGWQFAMTPSSRNRGTSSGWITWRWAMWCRESRAPFAVRAASHASRPLRTARSPIACMWTWKPSRVEGDDRLDAAGRDRGT